MIVDTKLYEFYCLLCDTTLSRNGDIFSLEDLHDIVSLVNDCPIIIGHDANTPAIARIIDGNIIDNSVIFKAYTDRPDVAHKVKTGIYKEVSIGCRRDLETGRIVEVFEVSFVGVPAQPKAGVIYQSYKEVTFMDDNKKLDVNNETDTPIDETDTPIDETETVEIKQSADNVIDGVESKAVEDGDDELEKLKKINETLVSHNAELEEMLKSLKAELAELKDKEKLAIFEEATKDIKWANDKVGGMFEVEAKKAIADEEDKDKIKQAVETILQSYNGTYSVTKSKTGAIKQSAKIPDVFDLTKVDVNTKSEDAYTIKGLK